MPMYFFTIPALHPQPAQDEFNRFCGAQRVLAVERQFVAAGLDSYWALCVTVASGAGALPDALKAPERRSGARADGGAAAARVDYKQVLTEQEFALYADLRTWRKAAAEQEGVPVYPFHRPPTAQAAAGAAIQGRQLSRAARAHHPKFLCSPA